jgi:hypothetical protein
MLNERIYKLWQWILPSSIESGMEKKMNKKREPDKRMWFSMWFLASVATFGLALFPMFYQLVERRNKHFLRQKELEKQVKALFKNEEKKTESSAELLPNRNARLWAASIILVLPAFIITYLLSRDLVVHEKQQKSFLSGLFPEAAYMPQNIAIKKYVLLTLATLGIGIIYWLYKIINTYNSHFKQEQKIEDQIVGLMEERGNG